MTYAIDHRVRVVVNYLQSQSLRKTAQLYNCSKSSVSNWSRLIKTSLLPKKRRRRNFTTVKNIIHDFVSSKHFVTLNEIQQHIISIIGSTLCKSTIRRLMKVLNFTRKRTKKVVYKNEEYMTSLSEKRKKFKHLIQQIPIDSIVSIDETSTKIDMFMSYYYSKRGEVVKKCVSSQYHRNNSVLSAITTNGCLLTKIQTTSYNSESFYNFIQELISKFHKKMTLLMDNVSFHKTKKVKKLIENSGHHVIYLPPYSPNYNPIEFTFSVLKHTIKHKNPTNESSLHKIINDTFKSFTKQYLKKCFNHSFHASHDDFKLALKDRFIVR